MTPFNPSDWWPSAPALDAGDALTLFASLMAALVMALAATKALAAAERLSVFERGRLTTSTGFMLAATQWANWGLALLAMSDWAYVRPRIDLALASALLALPPALLSAHLMARPQLSRRQILQGAGLTGVGWALSMATGLVAIGDTMWPAQQLLYVGLASVLVIGAQALALRWRYGGGPGRPFLLRSALALALGTWSMQVVGLLTLPPALLPLSGHVSGERERWLTATLGLTMLLAFALWNGYRVLLRYRSLVRSKADTQLRYQALLDNLPGLVMRLDAYAPWRIKLVSQRVTTLVQQPPEHLLDLPFDASALAPIDTQAREQLDDLLQSLTGDSTSRELVYRYQHPNGTVRWLELNARQSTALGEDGQYELDLVLADVTDRQLALERLEIARSIIHNSRDAIVSKTLEGTITSWNSGATEIFGYAAQEAIGMPITRLFREQDLHQEKELIAEVSAGRTVQSFEAVRLRKDGRPVVLSVSLSPVRDASGRIVGASKIARDISDRKLNDELRRQKEHAEQMAAMRGTFLANMSHELRTPMNAVLGFTSILLNSRLDEEQRKQVNAVHASARHLLGLLNDVLDAAKLEKGAMVLEARAFDLRELLAEVDASFVRAATSKGLAFGIVAAAGTPSHLVGDSLRVRQILLNLVDNAVKFTQAGQVRVHVKFDGALQIEISDTGIGMSEEQLAHVFEPFVQGDSSMSRRFGGTGLGMSICQQLVELMGGQLAVGSELGRGTTVTVQLPLAPASGEAPALLASRAELPPLRVLAVDDVELNLELLRQLLQPPHEVSFALSGREAVDMAGAQRFDLILMDVQMPGMDGLEAARRLREAERTSARPAVPIVALTASVLEKDKQEAWDAGMNAFVMKPIALDELLREMAQALRVVATAAPTPAATESVSAPAPLEHWLDAAAGTSIWGGMRELWLDALQQFDDELDAHVTAIVTAVREHNTTEGVFAVHALRGTASSVALVALFRLLDEMETRLRAGDLVWAAQQLGALQAAAAGTRAAVSQLTLARADEPWPQPQAGPLDAQDARARLERLRECLRRGEMPGSLVPELAQALGERLPSALRRRLSGAVDNFDYEQALAVVEEIADWLNGLPHND